MKFGDFQRQKREAAGFSINRLSVLTGISRGQLTNYEESKSEPTVKNAEAICNALGVAFTIGNEEIKINQSDF